MKRKPKLIVVMGVSGCGKSSVAIAIADRFNYEFVEADDFHPEENKQSMASGKPLTDAMREPWIALLQQHLTQLAQSGRSCVMSFSGLRRMHRTKMRDLPFEVQFLHLQGDQSLISQRMSKRADHFMPEALLDSQFAALEETNGEADIVSVGINDELDAVIANAIKVLP